MVVLKVISRLLCYPEAELQEAVPEMRAALASSEAPLPPAHRVALEAFLSDFETTPLFDLQERYVRLFDQGRALSLHLFEHVHGESRDRGQAMVDLLQRYQERGFTLVARELPDYLPLLLEYLSGQEREEVDELLGDAVDVIVLLGARLRERESGYHVLFDVLETVAGSPGHAAQLRSSVAREGPDPSITRMDEIWEEEQVSFLAGGGPDSCGKNKGNAPTMNPARWIDQRRPSRSRL